MPKTQRHGLGQSLENTVLQIMENLILAKNAPRPHKAGYLIKALSQQEVAILKLRLYLEMKLVNETRVFQAQSDLQDIGRMAGGWLKSLGTASAK